MSRLPKRLPAAVLVFGIVAWLVVMGAVLNDVLRVEPAQPRTPTVKAISVSLLSRATFPPTNPGAALVAASDTPSSTIATQEPTDISSATPLKVTSTEFSQDVAVTAAPTSASGCAATPPGWIAYTVQGGDTLFGFVLGSKGQLSVDDLLAANCLHAKSLALGQVLYLPPGVADNAPRIDDNPAGPALPAGTTRTAHCPCSITVRAGWRLEQIAEAINAVPLGFTGADFLQATSASAPVPGLPFLSSRPAGKSLEGFMFPGSYNLDNTTTATQFRDMLLNAFGANVSEKARSDAAAQGLSFWQAVVLASIVQRESYSASEQKLIASVFHNRMVANKGLGSTVTLQYALGRAGNWWPRVTGAQVNLANPYNTYLVQGLPPSPIDSPSLDAILAAVYPAQTNFQYFSAKCGGGGNFYAATFQEFQQGLQCN